MFPLYSLMSPFISVGPFISVINGGIWNVPLRNPDPVLSFFNFPKSVRFLNQGPPLSLTSLLKLRLLSPTISRLPSDDILLESSKRIEPTLRKEPSVFSDGDSTRRYLDIISIFFKSVQSSPESILRLPSIILMLDMSIPLEDINEDVYSEVLSPISTLVTPGIISRRFLAMLNPSVSPLSIFESNRFLSLSTLPFPPWSLANEGCDEISFEYS